MLFVSGARSPVILYTVAIYILYLNVSTRAIITHKRDATMTFCYGPPPSVRRQRHNYYARPYRRATVCLMCLIWIYENQNARFFSRYLMFKKKKKSFSTQNQVSDIHVKFLHGVQWTHSWENTLYDFTTNTILNKLYMCVYHIVYDTGTSEC